MPNAHAIVASDIIPWGGMERPNYELAWFLADALGKQVHLVSHRVAAPLSAHPNVVWHRVPRPLSRNGIGTMFLSRVGRKVTRRIEREGGRVIVNGGNCPTADVTWLHYVHNVPDFRCHRPGFAQHQWLRWKRRRDCRQEREVLGRARIVITDSDLVKERVIRELSVDAERVRTVYYGVDPELFRPATKTERDDARDTLGLSRDRPVVAFIGGLGHDRRKGFDVLFEAWSMCLANQNWDPLLVVAGTGPELKYWQRRTTDAGFENNVRFLGYTKSVSTVLAAADALVSPTRFEPYGQGVHEALCCGIPAFVTRCAGVSERFPGELSDLLLDAPPSASELFQRLRTWSKDVDSYRRRVVTFGEQLRGRTWSDMASEFIAAINGGEPPAPTPRPGT